MIHSMTGFGEAQLEEAGHAYHLEIRSVNNRYFKSSVHLPEDFAFLETDVRSALTSAPISRQHILTAAYS